MEYRRESNLQSSEFYRGKRSMVFTFHEHYIKIYVVQGKRMITRLEKGEKKRISPFLQPKNSHSAGLLFVK